MRYYLPKLGGFLLFKLKNMIDNLEINKNDKVGIVIAHPDDEVLMYELINYLCRL